MTTDETLRVLAAVEAVWLDDTAALESLTATAPGERSLPEAIASYAETAMRTLITTSYGIYDGMPNGDLAAAVERMRGDVGARMTKIWTQTLAMWAAGPTTLRTVADMCHTLISAILALTSDSTEDDVLPLLAQLREAVLASEF
ncbi:hypothetical protein [Kitasatospora aureofaciens]|uniref:hypothetical protein n=1 Tax=Kitasatospora aureofaciens TaxID=1894 RepID=UPI000526D4E2|nr:hypothetical protein [Kitasatospora aureofaciens]